MPKLSRKYQCTIQRSFGWQLLFHPEKCQDISTQWEVEQVQKRNETECEKDLEVHIDKNLPFEQHRQNITSAGNRIVGMIRRTFSHIDRTTFKCIYKGLIRSKLEYAAPVWSPKRAWEIDLIEGVQRKLQ